MGFLVSGDGLLSIFGDEAVDPWTWETWTGGGVIPQRRRGVEGIFLDGERS